MNGIEKITQRINADARVEIEQILSDARAQAEGIAASYRQQADKEAAALTAKNQKAAAEREERLVSVAQLEARKTLLGAKQKMVEKAFDRALEKMCSLPDAEYIAAMAALLVQAAPDGTGTAVFSEKDRRHAGAAAVAAANERIGGHLKLSEQTRAIRGGFILLRGSVEVNCTFETLVRLAKDETAGEAAKCLFPDA